MGNFSTSTGKIAFSMLTTDNAKSNEPSSKYDKCVTIA